MNLELSQAGQLAQIIKNVARTASSEEDVRIGVEAALRPVLGQLGVDFTPEYEKTLLRGSADAVYGHVVIEYKRPGRLAESGYPAVLSRQLGRYLEDLAEEHSSDAASGQTLEKLVGIGLDGQDLLFLRYSATGRHREAPIAVLPGRKLSFVELEGAAGGFQVIGPVPVTEESINLMLLYIRSLSRKPLLPETLGEVFGPDGAVAPRIVNGLYSQLVESMDHARVSTFYDEWERIFGLVYGEDLGNAGQDRQDLVEMYSSSPNAELKPLLFSLHTYYALLMKLLAVELASLQSGALVRSLVSHLSAMDDDELANQLQLLEDGGTFALLGISNFLEGDFFGWYLDVWTHDVANAIRELARLLAMFEPATNTLEPETTRDLLKKVYQYLVPKQLRHDLGEYYTPDWLADRLLNQVGYAGDLEARLIDPACGSGTFLVLALRRLRNRAADNLIPVEQILSASLTNIVGFDLNPLSVIAARTNILLAIGDILRYARGTVELPVSMADSVLTPTEHGDIFGKSYRLKTVVDRFELPGEIIDSGRMAELTETLESSLRAHLDPQDFLLRAEDVFEPEEESTLSALDALYRKLHTLHKEGRDGLWARLLKNAFAPVYVKDFDYVVGNPPWVNWESLSGEYRLATRQLWVDNGLFSLEGHAANLGGGKKDLSMLFTYVAMDNYLRLGGKLGFVITQTVFKSQDAGDGFRRFRLGEGGVPIQVIQVDDLSRLQPFEDATNRTSVMVVAKGNETRYPVPYAVWKAGESESKRVDVDSTLKEVLNKTETSNLYAQPIDSATPTSPWMVGRKRTLTAAQKSLGQSAYVAHAGSCTWMNGVYWVDVIAERPDGKIVVENLPAMGRKRLSAIRRAVQPDLVYPLLRGQEVGQWSADPEHSILMVQDPAERKGYSEEWLRSKHPEVYGFLDEFRGELEQRSGYKRYFSDSDPFYSIYNVDDFTFAPYKLVWREQASELTTAVVADLKGKPIVPDHKLMLVPFEDPDEAHYLCGALSSDISRYIVKSYVIEVSTSTHVLEYVKIPKFDPKSKSHTELAEASKSGHAATKRGDEKAVEDARDSANRAACDLWGITDQELADIRDSLAELS